MLRTLHLCKHPISILTAAHRDTHLQHTCSTVRALSLHVSFSLWRGTQRKHSPVAVGNLSKVIWFRARNAKIFLKACSVECDPGCNGDSCERTTRCRSLQSPGQSQEVFMTQAVKILNNAEDRRAAGVQVHAAISLLSLN